MVLEASSTYNPAADLVILILGVVVKSINMAGKIEDLSLRVGFTAPVIPLGAWATS